jgi:peptidoglycan-associated lipoprotein
MRVWIKYAFVLMLTIAAVSSRPAAAQETQPAPGAGQTVAPEPPLRADLALDYSYLRSNAPPGGCTCFNMNGGNASFAWPIKPGSFAFAADFTVEHIGNINSSNYTLTFGTLTVGARYFPHMRHSPLQPFGEALVGGTHAAGSLARPPNPLNNNAEVAFAAVLGGGLDMHVNRRFSVRLAEADYLPTTFDNGSNNHQNNFRISTGVVVRF